MESSLSPSSSSPHHSKHHVFPSFHGADVRKGFLSHLLKEFKSKGINAFIDNNMKRGELIGHELKEAIRGSRIAIVLLSKNYASSAWCLNELVAIMECRKNPDQTVVSLFYEVDPTDIKKQNGHFGKVFKKTCKGKTKKDMRRWKHALTEVAQIAGYHSTNWETDAKMIEDIAIDVSNKLNNSTSSSDFNGLVGMESQMRKMRRFLPLNSDEVRIIGILGPSGIGKTTIARYLFDQHSRYFQLSVFMESIKTIPACSDNYKVKLDLQKQFMSQLTNEVGIKIPRLGVAKDRLKDKKVLVVLDDVNRLVQLEAMAKETCWFGPGSRIIITTQDQKILTAGGIEHIHRVDLPSTDESLQMLCMYAFGQKYPKDGFTELASEVTRLVGGLPLWLRVMGTHFQGMCKENWIKALLSIETRLDPDWKIESILKFGYDALCDKDKRLFLHIACFFNHERVDIVEDCLASCFLDVTQGFHVLAEKYLISMDSKIIVMHTLLVQLGRKIVREKFVNEPGKRQYLDDGIDIGDVLNDDKPGSSSVLGIYLSDGNITCTSERAFERLSNLQFLSICSKGINPRSLNSISGELRFLCWLEFGMPCLPSNFNPKFLVRLDMRRSMLKKLWKKTQPLNNLKWMDLSDSYWLEELPDLSTATSLIVLKLSHCSRLVKLPSSIANATNLQKLNLSYCSSLVKLPSSIGNAVRPWELDLSYCSSLVELPSFIKNAVKPWELDLSYCSSLVEFPSFIGNAINLQKLDLSYCSSLVKFSSSIKNAVNPRELNLSYCSNMVELPSFIENAINLQKLDLSYCSSLVKFPFSIGNAFNPKELDLGYCSSLVELPSFIGKTINLQKLDSYCSSLVELPFYIGNEINLQKLNLSYCSSLVKLPSSLGNAINLWELDLSFCSSLVELPSSMKNLRKLTYLELAGCFKLEVILANINLEHLKKLNLSDCSLLSGTTVEYSWRSLHLPSISETCKIRDIGPWTGKINCLRRLVLSGMKNLVSLPQLPYSVVELEADNCESLERLDCSFLNPGIRLNFLNCFKLNQEARDLIIQTETNQYAVLPGGEVPRCFTYRSSGGSLTVKLNQSTSTKFKACIICADEVENDVDRVSCSIRSNENALTCYKEIGRVLAGNLYTFEVEAKQVTSTELVFEFQIHSYFDYSGDEEYEIKECGVLQILDDSDGDEE